MRMAMLKGLQPDNIEPGTGPMSIDLPDRYEDWRDRFIARRLRVLYIVGLVVNPIFIPLDHLAHAQHFADLLALRGILEAGLVLGLLALRWQVELIKAPILLAAWVIIPNICIAHMILIQSEQTLTYYNGLALVMLTAAVIVPVSWRAHLVAQIASLLYYYGALYVQGGLLRDTRLLSESAFILVFVCVALQISVILYERLQKAEFSARQAERRARVELEASNRKLLELDRMKSEFFANVSHELRTPLTLSLGAFRSLLGQTSEPDSRQLIQVGIRNASRLLFLINELLDLARFDSGRGVLRKRPFDLTALVRSVAANFESSELRRIHYRGLTQPVPIEADQRQLKKVLYNLLSNAFKFSDPKEAQVWIRLCARGEQVSLEVEDNGIGIPQENLDRIFDRFMQVEGGATRRFEGTGIGLALVKEVVTLHGGTIAVESEPGRGSTFTITLPQGEVGQEPLAALEDEDLMPPLGSPREPSGEGDAEPVPSGRDEHRLVLIVDDNADMRQYLKRVLSTEYRVALAPDGAEALRAAQAAPPDLILTDVMMPRMSGIDLLHAIRGHEVLRSTPVVFLTARVGAEARIESLEAGADDYIPKPFDEQEVRVRVRNLIQTKIRERSLRELQKEKLARFLPPRVAELILAGEERQLLDAHRKEITVLFIDLRGFTTFAETADPEDLLAVLREYQAEMGRLVVSYEGTLEHFSGDAMMVFFNDPLDQADHAERAIRLAVSMRDRVESLRQGWLTRGFELGAGIGIATGYAMLGVVGSEQRQDYAAIGPVTNLAARLCGEAQHGQILVSSRFLMVVQHLVQANPIGELTLKGFHRPVTTYNVLAVHAT